MKVKFNKFERVAGLFVLTAFAGAVFAIGSVAIKKGWFEKSLPLKVMFTHAEGIHPGTEVKMAGLRVGAVERVVLAKDNSVEVHLSVLADYFANIKKDSRIRVIRPFVIGEKVLEITTGSIELEPLEPGQTLAVIETLDIMDFLSGSELGTSLSAFAKASESMQVLMTALSDKKLIQSLVDVMSELNPLVKDLKKVTRGAVSLTAQLNREERVGRILKNLAFLTDELGKHEEDISTAAPQVAKQLVQTLGDVSEMTHELKKVLPAVSAIAPDLPRTSLRLVEAVDETVITLKAIQKTFLMRGKVKEVLKEEQQKRMPANE